MRSRNSVDESTAGSGQTMTTFVGVVSTTVNTGSCTNSAQKSPTRCACDGSLFSVRVTAGGWPFKSSNAMEYG